MTEICPICRGKGKIPYGAEALPNVVMPTTTSLPPTFVQCHGCFGRGWIEPYYHGYPDHNYPTYPIPMTTDPIQSNVC